MLTTSDIHVEQAARAKRRWYEIDQVGVPQVPAPWVGRSILDHARRSAERERGRTRNMSGEIRIRRAALGDQVVLASLSADVHELHVSQRPDVFKPVDVLGLERWFRDQLASRDAKIWIAQIGDTPVGYALAVQAHRVENVFCYERRWYEIDQVGVRPQYRRRGVGRRLLEHIVEFAKTDGVSDIQLNTWTFNDLARASFERLGFVSRNVRLERSAEPGAREHVQLADEPDRPLRDPQLIGYTFDTGMKSATLIPAPTASTWRSPRRRRAGRSR
jgi:diamine N-acetyltransferase